MTKPKIFIQECGTYSNEILVICGATKKETFKYLKKIKANIDFSKWVLEDYDEWKNAIEKKQLGLFCWHLKVEGYVLFLRPMVDSWNYWEVLMHELHHATLQIARTKMFLEENENQAYLFEYLFHSIRRKLQEIDEV